MTEEESSGLLKPTPTILLGSMRNWRAVSFPARCGGPVRRSGKARKRLQRRSTCLSGLYATGSRAGLILIRLLAP